MEKRGVIIKYSFLILASILLAFTSLRFGVFLVPWISMVFFIYYFRKQNRWFEYPLFFLLLFIPKFFTIHKGWDISVGLELLATLFTLSPILIALLTDKYFHKRTNSIISTFVFPATYVILDLLIGLSPFGTFSSIALTQIEFKSLIQIASITGMGGISFMVFWFSSTVATIWKSNFNIQKEKLLMKIFVFVFLGIVLLGGIYYVTSIPTGETVKIAGISVSHNGTDYSSIIDRNTSKEEVSNYSADIKSINDELFLQSQKAADFGAKIIFWSEINGIVYPEIENDFITRAQNFAKDNNVYFAPAILSFNYNTNYGKNEIIMINPEGKIVYEYEKTISWYQTKSNGIIDTIETPYGKIGTVICFDADFPRFVRQAAKENVDILIIPKFDTQQISPGHTYSGLLRGIEGGFSAISQVNEGISMASDYRGNVVAYQDYFTTQNKIMTADLPIKGRKTLYSIFGDWFIYLNALFLIILTIYVLRKKK
jgi:apolipoprotein N-acyltransferase